MTQLTNYNNPMKETIPQENIKLLENVSGKLSEKEVELIMNLIDLLFWDLDNDRPRIPS